MPPRDLRRVLQWAWDQMESADAEAVSGMGRQVWEAAFSEAKEELVKGHEFICKDCGRKQIHDVPMSRMDILTVAKTLEILQTLTWGKPVEERRLTITVSTAEELNSRSDEELILIAGAEDAEWAPLELPERVA